MQLPPITFDSVTLLFALGAVLLFITVELANPHYSRISLTINPKKLRNVAFVVSLVFLATFLIRIISIIIEA